jgi:copper chaperone CopZ
MMSNTPRVFVGTTTFLVTGMSSASCVQTVIAAVTRFAGVRVLSADLLTGLVTVTAERPVNRVDLTAEIVLAGYSVSA